jgi:pimeloyl-ACP methyl ester carboxylesterase
MRSARCEDVFVDVPDGVIYVKKWIPESARHSVPVILLHDSLGSTELWRDFPEKLANYLSRIVISYDRLGFGKSTEREALPDKGFIWEEADIFFPCLKKALAVDKYVLFGHSVGGAMAIAVATKDNDCAAVITEAAQAFVEDLTVSGLKNAKVAFQQPSQIERLEKWHGKKAMWALRAWTEVWLSPEFASWSLEPCIGKVACPVLAIHGDKDEYGSIAFPKFISEKIGRDSKMVILEGCGHVPHREKLREVMGCVLDFLDDHGIN